MSSPPPGDTRANIVLIMMDQLAAKWLETAEERQICDLPNFRWFRENGVNFTRDITANPVCCPTRATIATGLSSRGHGLIENGYYLDPSLPTFMKLLRDIGYTTGAFGKIHLRPHNEAADHDYKPYGFDIQHVVEDHRGGEWLDWIRTEHPEYLDAVFTTIPAEHLKWFSHYGPDDIDLRSEIVRIRAGHTWSSPAHPEDSSFAHVLPFPQELSQTEWITRAAEDFLRTHAGSPFFAQISYVQPHNPFGVPEKYLDHVDRDRIPEPVGREWLDDPDAPGYFTRHRPLEVSDHRNRRAHYFADLVHLDEQLGRIFAALRSAGRLDSTYVIFTADHGELLGDHGFYTKEERHYDACVRIPLYIRGPGLLSGAADDGIVQHEDICPTILDMAGTSMPGMAFGAPHLTVDPDMLTGPDELVRIPGTSLLPRCTTRGIPSARTSAYVESYNSPRSQDYHDWVRTVRGPRWRYTYWAGCRDEQLFDLDNDPDEQRNLAKNPEFATVRAELRDELLEHVIRQDWPKTPRSLFSLGSH
jgi:arylsulfatase